MKTVQKTNIGKYLIIGIKFCILTTLISCEDGNGTLVEINLRYRNNTSKAITITHYSRNGKFINSLVPETLNIESGSVSSFYSTKMESSDNDNTIDDFQNFIVDNRLYDSLYLSFEEEKFNIFSKGELNTSIFFLENYEGSEIKENTFEFTYEFTEEDYANADLIGG